MRNLEETRDPESGANPDRDGDPARRKCDQLVIDFILDRVNPVYLDAYNTLASLKYPIEDYRSVVARLAEAVKADNAGATLLQLTLSAVDLPFLTAQGALEKFHERLLTRLEHPRGLRRPAEELEPPPGWRPSGGRPRRSGSHM